MLIKYEDKVINFDNVLRFFKRDPGIYEGELKTEKNICIKFEFGNGFCSILFEKEEERDKAFEHILNCWTWERRICSLD